MNGGRVRVKVREVRGEVETDHMGSGSHQNSSGELFKLPTSRLHPRPIKTEPLGMRLRYWYFLKKNSLDGSDVQPRLKIHDFVSIGHYKTFGIYNGS